MTEFEVNYVEPSVMKPRVRIEKISTPIQIPDYAIQNGSDHYGTTFAWIDYEGNPWIVGHDGRTNWTVKTGQELSDCFPHIVFGKPVHDKTILEECEEMITTIVSWLDYDIQTPIVADDTRYAAEMHGLVYADPYGDVEHWETAVQDDMETLEYFTKQIGDLLARLK